MPAAKNRKKKEPVNEGPMQEIIATILFGISFLLFLSLVSFNAYDTPSWLPISVTDRPNDPVQNAIGPLGALFASAAFFLFGFAAYLIPTGLIWFGACMIVASYKMPRFSWIGFGIFVLSAACLLHIQGIALTAWRDYAHTPGPGGGIGYALGGTVLSGIIGRVGSSILLTASLTIGVAMMTGTHPILFFCFLRDSILKTFRHLRSNGLGSLPTFRRTYDVPVSDAQRASRSPARKRAPRKAVEAEEPEIALEDLPEPRIFDASASQFDDTDEKKKPTIEELREELRKKRENRTAPAPGTVTDLAAAYDGFELPPLHLLEYSQDKGQGINKDILLETQRNIIRTLSTFNIKVTPGDITCGPTITRYEVYPAEGLRVKRISDYEADIARATKAETINILAPIPGRDTVGIEIANSNKILVTLRELLQDDTFTKTKAKIPLALGKDVYGKTIVGDLAAMPHLLVSGATGAGKSVCINCIIASLLYNFRPDELRFVMVDPKVVEMQPYQNLPHLAIPLVTEPKKTLLALRWVVKEMENRYQVFKKVGCRDFTSFNNRAARKEAKDKKISAAAAKKKEATPTPAPDLASDAVASHAVSINPDIDVAGGAVDYAPPLPGLEIDELVVPDKLPYIVVIIDELADLMDTSPADVELAIVRIAQMARAAGIHLILATQTPRADVITGRIRANVPSKIAFRVSSALESRVILENKGAERLVGKGDMLFLPPGTSTLCRAQGALITDEEVENLVAYITEQGEPIFEGTGASGDLDVGDPEDDITPEDEETLERCIEVLRQEQRASTSMLQRRLRLGYNRASRMMDILEAKGFVGPGEGAKPREILVDLGTRHDG